MENTLFPIRMEMHIAFALIALLVFGLQFIRTRKKYYLLLAIAIPCSLLPYLWEDNKMFFYWIGIGEAVALIGAFILARTVDRDKEAPEQPEAAREEAPTEEAPAEAAAEPSAQPEEPLAETAPEVEETE